MSIIIIIIIIIITANTEEVRLEKELNHQFKFIIF